MFCVLLITLSEMFLLTGSGLAALLFKRLVAGVVVTIGRPGFWSMDSYSKMALCLGVASGDSIIVLPT
jgi:hypothetical protein